MSYNCEKPYCLCVVFIWYPKDIKHIILKPVFDSFADQVSVDDDVLVHENGNLIPAKVTGISNIELQGLGQILYSIYFMNNNRNCRNCLFAMPIVLSLGASHK